MDLRISSVAVGLSLIIPSAEVVLPAGVTRAFRELRADVFRAHMAFLADDRLDGRETGTRGYDLAAQYVAGQFRRLGLAPVAGSYTQSMRIQATAAADGAVALWLVVRL